MIKYQWKVFGSNITDELVMLLRPILFMFPILFFSKYIANETIPYLSFGAITAYIQSDFMIGINYRYYLLKENDLILDIKLSKTNLNLMILTNYSIQLIALFLLQVVMLGVFVSFKAIIYIVIMSILSIAIGIYLLDKTEEHGTFIIVSKITSILFVTGSSMIPLKYLPEAIRYVLMINPYTCLFELIRNTQFEYLQVFDNRVLVSVFICEIIILCVIGVIKRKRIRGVV